MKTILALLGTLAISALAAPGANIERRADSHPFTGTNLYFLQGLSDSDQDSYIASLKDFGINVLRVWVNGQNGDGHCEKGSKIVVSVPALETTLGKYNDQTLDALDKVINKLAKSGIKALVSPHDANSLQSSRSDAYNARWGSGYFYEKQEAFDMYDDRLTHILSYKGKYSGKVWKDWHEGIVAFDLQNEPMTTKTAECTSSDKYGWTCGRARHLRQVLGSNNPIKIATGGIGGDIAHGCNLISAATQCDAIDLISIHRYAGPESSNPNQWANSEKSWLNQANGKLVYIEEWGVNTDSYDASKEYPANMQDMINAGVPQLYWQILPKKVCDYQKGSDPFGIHIGSNVPIKEWIGKMNNAKAAQDWSSLGY